MAVLSLSAGRRGLDGTGREAQIPSPHNQPIGMTVESFRWLATPGCGVAAFLLVYDTHRALQPRIAGEQPWRESRVLGMATLVLGTLVLQRLEGPAWMNGAITVVLGLALVSLLWNSVTLRRLVADVLRQNPDD